MLQENMPTREALAMASEDSTHGPSPLLVRLAMPRENGTPGLLEARAVLDSALRQSGHVPELQPFACHAGRSEAAALALLCSAILVLRAGRDPRRRSLLMLLCAWGLAFAAIAGGLDFLLPGAPATNILLRVEPRAAVHHEILLSAHYDTKTEPLDHVGRSALFGSVAIACITTLVAIARRRRVRRFGGATAVLLVTAAAQLALGRILPQRSHGIVDNGAACALLVDLAQSVAAQPFEHTRLVCAWFAAEEWGAQGSSAAAAALARAEAFVNLEAIGAGSEPVIAAFEMSGATPRRADRSVADRLQHAAARPLRVLRAPLVTDAGPLLDAGIPGLTLLTIEPGAWTIRSLHGSGDRLPRFDASGAAAARALLLAFLTATDSAATGESRQRQRLHRCRRGGILPSARRRSAHRLRGGSRGSGNTDLGR